MYLLFQVTILTICCYGYTVPQFVNSWPPFGMNPRFSPNVPFGQLPGMAFFNTSTESGQFFQTGANAQVIEEDDDDDDLFIKRKDKNKIEATEDPDLPQTKNINKSHKKYKDVEFGWNKYYNLNEIEDWLHSLVEKYDFVDIISLPEKTYQDREIMGVKIDIPVRKPHTQKKIVVIESNMNGNEWLSSSATTYFLNQLLESTDGSPLDELAKNYIWYFFPVTNPDGFAFCHSNPKNKFIRNWRKTRTPTKVKNCFGVDPAYNFDFKWRGTENDGKKRKECLGTYSGPYPGSEPCVSALSTFLSEIAKDDLLHAYFSFHADHNSLALPYAHTKDPLDNYNEMLELGYKAANITKEKYGTVYKVGSKYELFCEENQSYSEKCEANEEIPRIMGGSTEYVKAHYNPPIVFQINLRGSRAIEMPKVEILPTGQESTLALETIMVEYIKLHPEQYIKHTTTPITLPTVPSSTLDNRNEDDEESTEVQMTTKSSKTKQTSEAISTDYENIDDDKNLPTQSEKENEKETTTIEATFKTTTESTTTKTTTTELLETKPNTKKTKPNKETEPYNYKLLIKAFLTELRVLINLFREVIQTASDISHEITVKSKALNLIQKLLNQVAFSDQKVKLSLSSLLKKMKTTLADPRVEKFENLLLEYSSSYDKQDEYFLNEEWDIS